MDIVLLFFAVVFVLFVLGIRSVLYFHRHRRDLDSWVLDTTYFTVVSITAVAGGLLAIRIVSLLIGPQGWMMFVSLTLIGWLLLTPFLIHRAYAKHEGGDQ